MERLAYYKPEFSPPEITTTLPRLILERAAKTPTKDAYVFKAPGKPRRAVSFGDLATSAKAAGQELLGLELEKGERVGIIGPNCPEWLFSYYGAVFAGLVVLRLKTEMLDSTEQFKDLINKHKVAALIVHPGENGEITSRLCEVFHQKQLLKANVEHLKCSSMPGLKHIVSMIPTMDSINPTSVQSDTPSQPDPLLSRVRRGDPADMLEAWFTSGSTGAPKAVAVSHKAMLSFNDTFASIALTQESRFWNNRLFSWIGSSTALPIVAGCTLVTSPPAQNDVQEILQILRDENITVGLFLPFMLHDFIEYHEKNEIGEQVSGLERVMTGGERLSHDLLQKCSEFLPELIIGYGGTEIGGVAYSACLGHETVSDTSTDGKKAPDMKNISPYSLAIEKDIELKIVSGNGDIVSRNAIGEILVRPPKLFMEYLDDKEQTAAAVDEDGWFHTGDLGRMSDDDLLTIDGRVKNIISRATIKVYPAVVENTILEIPQVSKVCVIGLPHARLFEEICACVVMASPASLTSSDILDICKERCTLNPSMVENMPDHVICFDEFPLNSNGKVDALALKRKAMEHLGRLE